MKDYSQCGEQEILIKIFESIKTTNQICVEFGAQDGENYSNTKYFRDLGWQGILFDCNPAYESEEVHLERLTQENINEIFEGYGIPSYFDLLSVDVDGVDFWLLKALNYHPRVIVVEYNVEKGFDESITVKYDQNFLHDQTDYYGASFKAFEKLFNEKGYKIIANTNLNLVAVKESEITEDIPKKFHIERLNHIGWPPDNKKREWVKI